MSFINSAVGFANRTGFMKRRRNRFKRRYPRVNNMSDAAAKIFGLQKQVNFIKGLVNVEKKLFTNYIGPVNVGNTGTVTVLSTISAGDDVNNRNGNSILAKYISGLITFSISTSATATTYVRVIVFIDKMNQGSTPTVSSVLDTTSPVAPINVDNTDRYWVIYNKLVPLAQAGQQDVTLKMFRRLNYHMKFTGINSTDFQQGAISVLVISDQATNTPSWQAAFRIAYIDN